MSLRLRVWRLAVDLLFGRDDVAAFSSEFQRDATSSRDFWSALISVANEHLVTAAVWSALRRRELVSVVPVEVAEYLRSFHDYNRARNRAIQAQLAECIGALNRSGIEPLLLKGAAYLSAELYGDIGERFLADVDLLVPHEAVDETRRIARDLGYRAASDVDYSEHHHLVPMVRDAGPVALELHTAPVPAYAQAALPTAALWADATPGSAGGVRYRLPAPTDAAMLSFLHSEVADRHLELLLIPLRLLQDQHVLHLRHGREIDWRRNFGRAAEIGAQGALRRYLHALRAIAGDEPFAGFRASTWDALRLSLCTAAVSWPAILHWRLRVDRFSERKIRKKYGATAGGAALHRYRLSELGAMLGSKRQTLESDRGV